MKKVDTVAFEKAEEMYNEQLEGGLNELQARSAAKVGLLNILRSRILYPAYQSIYQKAYNYLDDETLTLKKK